MRSINRKREDFNNLPFFILTMSDKMSYNNLKERGPISQRGPPLYLKNNKQRKERR